MYYLKEDLKTKRQEKVSRATIVRMLDYIEKVTDLVIDNKSFMAIDIIQHLNEQDNERLQ